MRFNIDLDYLSELLNRYGSLKSKPKSKEKINIRNSIMELLIPCVKAILLTYKVPLDFDMFQEAMLHLMGLIEEWNPAKTRRKKNGDAGDLAFFVRCTHNWCKNYILKQHRHKQREITVDPLEQPYWKDIHNWELPREIHVTKIRHLKDENLQNAYLHCLDILLGNSGEHNGMVQLKQEIRGKFGLTYQNTKDVLQITEETIREYIEGLVE